MINPGYLGPRFFSSFFGFAPTTAETRESEGPSAAIPIHTEDLREGILLKL